MGYISDRHGETIYSQGLPPIGTDLYFKTSHGVLTGTIFTMLVGVPCGAPPLISLPPPPPPRGGETQDFP